MQLRYDNHIYFYIKDDNYLNEYSFTLKTKGFGYKLKKMLEEYNL